MLFACIKIAKKKSDHRFTHLLFLLIQNNNKHYVLYRSLSNREMVELRRHYEAYTLNKTKEPTHQPLMIRENGEKPTTDNYGNTILAVVCKKTAQLIENMSDESKVKFGLNLPSAACVTGSMMQKAATEFNKGNYFISIAQATRATNFAICNVGATLFQWFKPEVPNCTGAERQLSQFS